MTLELIAVQGMTVIVDPTTPSPPGAVVAVISVLPPTGTKVRCTSLVHRDGDKISVSAITVPSAAATIPDPGPYEVGMVATASKVKAEGVLVLRQGDQSETINATPQIPNPGGDPIDYPVSFKCVVQVAGQLKAKAQ